MFVFQEEEEEEDDDEKKKSLKRTRYAARSIIPNPSRALLDTLFPRLRLAQKEHVGPDPTWVDTGA
jgi:hypothetical protein